MANPLGNKEQTHESYGMIGFSRVSIGGSASPFFGSDLESHLSCVRLKIARGVKISTDGHDFFMERDRLIEVDLTSAQFAELLTTLNVGSGVPCTIRSLDGKMVPPPPAVPTQADDRRATFEKKAHEVSEEARALVEKMRASFADKSVSKGKRDELVKDLERIVMGIDRNLPYFLETFREATQEIVGQAKAEVSSYVAQAAMTAGIEALSSENVQNLLPDGREDDAG